MADAHFCFGARRGAERINLPPGKLSARTGQLCLQNSRDGGLGGVVQDHGAFHRARCADPRKAQRRGCLPKSGISPRNENARTARDPQTPARGAACPFSHIYACAEASQRRGRFPPALTMPVTSLSKGVSPERCLPSNLPFKYISAAG